MVRQITVERETRQALADQGAIRVLVVEDMVAVSSLIAAALRAESMVVDEAATGVRAIAGKLAFVPDVVLVDLGLPDMDGLRLVERFAQDGDCGVIVVTEGARGASPEDAA